MFKCIDKTIKYSLQVKMGFFKLGDACAVMFCFGLLSHLVSKQFRKFSCVCLLNPSVLY